MQPKGTLELHRFNGTEIFKISKAEIFVLTEEDGSHVINLEIDTEEAPIQTLPDTESLRAHPNAEVTAKLDSLNPDEWTGQSFHTTNSEDLDCRLYYCEHEDVENVHIQVKRQVGNRFHVHWAGTATDVNFYDGSKPDTRIEVDAWFVFSDYLNWKLK